MVRHLNFWREHVTIKLYDHILGSNDHKQVCTLLKTKCELVKPTDSNHNWAYDANRDATYR